MTGHHRVKVTMKPGWERAVAASATKAMAARFQPILDSVHSEYSGRPVDDIKPVLAQRWASGNDGASITDPELTNVAQAISDGKRVVMVDGNLTTN